MVARGPARTIRDRPLPAMLRRMREEAGLTQRDLAQRIGTHVWVHKSEIGERRVDVMEFIDWALGCGVEPENAFAELRRQRGSLARGGRR